MTIKKVFPQNVNQHAATRAVAAHVEGSAIEAIKTAQAPRQPAPKMVIKAELQTKTIHHTRAK